MMFNTHNRATESNTGKRNEICSYSGKYVRSRSGNAVCAFVASTGMSMSLAGNLSDSGTKRWRRSETRFDFYLMADQEEGWVRPIEGAWP